MILSLIRNSFERIHRTRPQNTYTMLCAFCLRNPVDVTIKSMDEVPTMHACEVCSKLDPKVRARMMRNNIEKQLMRK